MDQKQVGIIIIILGIVMMGFTYYSHQRDITAVQNLVMSTGTCFLDDGTCLHEESSKYNMIGWIVSTTVILFGVYLAFIDKTQKTLQEHQVKVSSALAESKQKDEFKAFLAGFAEDEKKVLEIVKEQEGIKQSTLRYKAGMSKASLSLLLKELEKKEIISRKASGKTNEIFLVKKF